MVTKLLEIQYCVECPHCNGFFQCCKLGRAVDEIPEDCPLESICYIDRGTDPRDTQRLNFLEQQARVSRTGISLDYAPAMEGEPGGYRFMRYRKLYSRKKNAREAIDEALNVFHPNRP